MGQIAIVGAGGHAVSVAETAASAGYSVRCFIDDNPRSDSLLGVPIVSVGPRTVSSPTVECSQSRLGITRCGNASRSSGSMKLLAQSSLRWCTHLRRCRGTQTIGEGSVVLQGAIVGSSARVGRFCIMKHRRKHRPRL